MSVNYERVCRLCLSSRGELLPIFPTTSSDDSEPPVLASKIKDCVSIQINENDDLPTNVCKKCVNNVNNWHLFKNVCERTQNKLQSLISQDGSQLEEVNVKSEPLSDEAYDDGVVIDGSYTENENVRTANNVQPEGPPILASLGLTPRSDKNYVDPRMDWHRVHAILDMVQDNEVIDSLQSKEECDVLQYSDHCSDSETELLPEVHNDYVDCSRGYIVKNKTVIAKNPMSSTAELTVKLNEVQKLRKRKRPSGKYCSNPKTAWQLFFTDDILSLIVTSTNENICSAGDLDKSVNVNEIKAVIGILYWHGIMRPTHQKCSDLWNSATGVPCIKNVMKYERFKFILENMRFDNADQDSIMEFDVMKRMRKVFEIFSMNCRNVHQIENVAVIDEILVPVYGPCPFRYNIDKKPLKSGIKMVLLVDPSTFYISNLDVITEPYFRPEDITKRIVQHLSGSGRNIVMDSWFTSYSLVESLKTEHQLFTIGCLNPNSELIPLLFLSQYRKPCSLMSGFVDDEVSMTSYVNSEMKAVSVITNEPKFYRKAQVQHTNAVSVYKKHQSAVEVVDVLMNYYTTMQHTNNWTLSLFFTLLNIASVNAQVKWCSQAHNRVTQRKLFIKELALSLIANLKPVLPSDDGKRMKYSVADNVQPFTGRRKCRICLSTTKLDRRTKQGCMICGQAICKTHTISICATCNEYQS